jgi:fructoselysine-6-P-deglycase FrlB-like protein
LGAAQIAFDRSAKRRWKLRRFCNLHAEGFSGAEFQHGPMALRVNSRYPILMFCRRPRGRAPCARLPPI